MVEGGNARRLAGTGDDRTVLRGGHNGVALNRTATLVFYLGPRHFGTLTAYVIGPDAAAHRFTSSLPVQILKSMGPMLTPYLQRGAAANVGCVPERALLPGMSASVESGSELEPADGAGVVESEAANVAPRKS